jgi:hypothetical protein
MCVPAGPHDSRSGDRRYKFWPLPYPDLKCIQSFFTSGPFLFRLTAR